MRPLNLIILATSLSLFAFAPECIAVGLYAQAIEEPSLSNRQDAETLFQKGKRQLYAGELQAALESFNQDIQQRQRVKDRSGEAASLLGISETSIWLGAHQDALIKAQQAFAIYQELGDRVGQAEALHRMGDGYLVINDLRSAMKDLQQALTMRQELQDRQGEGWTLGLLGIGQLQQGKSAMALDTLQQAIKILREPVDSPLAQLEQQYRQSVILGWIGNAHFQLNQIEQASEVLREALNISKKIGNRALSANAYSVIGAVANQQDQSAAALLAYEQQMAMYEAVGNRISPARGFQRMGQLHEKKKQYELALKFYEQGLTVARAEQEPRTEGWLIYQIGLVQSAQAHYPAALKSYQQALSIAERVAEQPLQANTLAVIGHLYLNQANYTESLSSYQQALEITQIIEDRALESRLLDSIGTIYSTQDQYSQALKYHQQALTIAQDIKSQSLEATSRRNIASVYQSQGQYLQALKSYQQVVRIAQDISDLALKASALSGLSSIYREQGKNEEALFHYQQALTVYQAMRDDLGMSDILQGIGGIYEMEGEYTKALENYQESLKIRQRMNNRARAASTLNSIGSNYSRTADYAQALDYYQQALAIQQQIGDPIGVAASLTNMGIVYGNLGKYDEALKIHQKALLIVEEANHPVGISSTLSNIGQTYSALKRYSEALEAYQQALDISERMGRQAAQAVYLGNIGGIHIGQRDYDRALDYYQQALVILRKIGAHGYEGAALQNIGAALGALGRHEEAWGFYQQALAIHQTTGDRAGQASTLSNMGLLLKAQNQRATAIAFLKQSVNSYEQIRVGVRELSQSVQKTYADTVESTYRNLADLLFSQGRILEAQKVLELLKVEELRQSTRSSVTSSGKIELTDAEKEVMGDTYTSLIAFSQKIGDCDPNCPAHLYAQETKLQTEYNEVVRNFEATIRERESQDDAFLDPNLLSNAAKGILQNAKTPTILVYPFVTEKKLWIFWTGIDGNKSILTNAISVDTNQGTLSKQIYAFRKLMEDCETKICETADILAAQAAAQQLYKTLLPPQLMQEIEQNNIQNLVFSLDRVTRYIPMSALFDGEKYLIQRYTVSTILSAELIKYDNPLPPGTAHTSVLAFGLTESVPANPAENMPEFRALAYVRNEIEAIVQQGNTGIYSGEERLDPQFDLKTLEVETRRHQILHIATHGEFVPAAGLEQSYLVLGTKQPLRIPQLENIRSAFAGLSLVVLSACQTALGEEGENGVEIAGVAHSFITAGVNSVVASLWQVEDRSTATLMQQFYHNLAQATDTQPVPVSHALRDAQRSLITGDSADGSSTRAPGSVALTVNGITVTGKPDYAHPYYWAPFILIGNGL